MRPFEMAERRAERAEACVKAAAEIMQESKEIMEDLGSKLLRAAIRIEQLEANAERAEQALAVAEQTIAKLRAVDHTYATPGPTPDRDLQANLKGAAGFGDAGLAALAALDGKPLAERASLGLSLWRDND